MPVIDSGGVLLGIVTVDDILEVAKQTADKDIREVRRPPRPLDEPYFATSDLMMCASAGTWLIMLFLGELMTGTALRY